MAESRVKTAIIGVFVSTETAVCPLSIAVIGIARDKI